MEKMWAQSELSAVNLGDKRLDHRLHQLGQAMYESPGGSINSACNNWSEAKAAYRFLDNPKVIPEKLLEPHSSRTVERCGEYPVVLLVQDTSFFNFTSHYFLEGAGVIGTTRAGSRPSQGLIAHTVLAVGVSGEGVPLGMVHQDIWARPERKHAGKGRRKELAKTAPEQKESFKWVKGILESPKNSDDKATHYVHVADREADVNSFIASAIKEGVSYLVRSNFNRKTKDGQKLRDFTEALPIAGTTKVEIAAVSETKEREKQDYREAELTIRHSRVKLCTEKKDSHFDGWVISATEESKKPEVKNRIHWTLLTNLPVESYESALEKIHWYRMRWHIENFHKVLKSGCKVEQCEVETADRLKNFMTIMSIVAWRLYCLSRAARAHPKAEAKEYFTPEELAVLGRIQIKSQKKSSPKLTLEIAVLNLACLGGFKARASDGLPGMISIWRGWQALQNYLQVVNAIGSTP